MASKLMKIPAEEVEYLGESVQDKNGNTLSLRDIGERAVSFEGKNQIITTATWGGETSPPHLLQVLQK